jgi:hypothetical protein
LFTCHVIHLSFSLSVPIWFKIVVGKSVEICLFSVCLTCIKPTFGRHFLLPILFTGVFSINWCCVCLYTCSLPHTNPDVHLLPHTWCMQAPGNLCFTNISDSLALLSNNFCTYSTQNSYSFLWKQSVLRRLACAEKEDEKHLYLGDTVTQLAYFLHRNVFTILYLNGCQGGCDGTGF